VPLPDHLAARGLPLTVIEDGGTFLIQPAGRGWRCGILAGGRTLVTGRGHTLVEVDQMSAVPGWHAAALAEGRC
jgi:hypothetical protein